MSIKLKGSSDGSVSFDAPADTSPSGSDITLTLPTSAGSANQFLKNSGIAGELEYSSMVETSTGVGIGVTSPATRLDISNTSRVKFDLSNAYTLQTHVNAAGSSFASSIASASDFQFQINNSEKLRLDSSGRLLVGHASARTNFIQTGLQSLIAVEDGGTPYISATKSSSDQFEPFFILAKTRGSIGGNTIVQNGDGLGTVMFQGADGSTLRQGAHISAFVDGTPGPDDMPGRLAFYTTADGAGSSTERMRIVSGGSVLFNNTTSTTPGLSNTTVGGSFENLGSNGGAFFCSRNGGSAYFANRNSDGIISEFRRSGTTVGSVSVTSSSAAYNTSSDYRLKENVVDLDGAITRVKQLSPKRFNFIVDADTTVDGFLAHEAQTVVPEAVTGTHNEVDDDGNAVMQGIDQSKLVPLLTAALQEAIAKIETLETKVAALEAA